MNTRARLYRFAIDDRPILSPSSSMKRASFSLI